MSECKPVDDRAIVALIAGIVSVMFVLFTCQALLNLFGLFAGILAIGGGYVVLKEGKGGRGLAIAGIVLSTIGICAWFLMTLSGLEITLLRSLQ